MDVILVTIGALLAIVPAIDVFRELFQPRGRGLVSRFVARAWWAVLRGPARRSSFVASFVGPVIMLTIIVAWLLCAVVGWGLVYVPSMDGTGAFIGHSGDASIMDAMYLSLVTISTLGYGDVVPSADWARLLVPLEALFGLGVAAGTIGWLMNLQPVLSHRSSLASKVGLLVHVERELDVDVSELAGMAPTVHELTTHLASVHSDLMHFPVSYHFFAGERLRSLPDQIDVLLGVADRCAASEDAVLRMQGAMLKQQIVVTVRAVAREFLGAAARDATDTVGIIGLWRADHQQARRAPT